MAGVKGFADRESDFRVVLNWLKEPNQRREVWFFCGYGLMIIGGFVALLAFDPGAIVLGEGKKSDTSESLSGVILGVGLTGGPLLIAAQVAVMLKARELRLGHTDDILYVEHYKLQLERQYKLKKMQLEAERDEWQDKKAAELYEAILDQVERGILKPRNEDPGDSYDFPKRGR